MSEVSQDVVDVLQEAREDLVDAFRLSKGGEDARAMAAFHAEQAAEKALRALCEARDIQTNWQWDITKLSEILELNQEEIDEKVRLLQEYSTPVKNGLENGSLQKVLEGARSIMEYAYTSLGIEFEPVQEPQEVPEQPRKRSRRPSRQTRRSLPRKSYVKRYYICPRCGVKVPFTRQTANGRVRCPHCGGTMKLVQ